MVHLKYLASVPQLENSGDYDKNYKLLDIIEKAKEEEILYLFERTSQIKVYLDCYLGENSIDYGNLKEKIQNIIQKKTKEIENSDIFVKNGKNTQTIIVTCLDQFFGNQYQNNVNEKLQITDNNLSKSQIGKKKCENECDSYINDVFSVFNKIILENNNFNLAKFAIFRKKNSSNNNASSDLENNQESVENLKIKINFDLNQITKMENLFKVSNENKNERDKLKNEINEKKLNLNENNFDQMSSYWSCIDKYKTWLEKEIGNSSGSLAVKNSANNQKLQRFLGIGGFSFLVILVTSQFMKKNTGTKYYSYKRIPVEG